MSDLLKEINAVCAKMAARRMVERLKEPSLADALDPTKYRIVRITPDGFDVVPVEPSPSQEPSK